MEPDHFITPPSERAKSGQLLLHIADDVLNAISHTLKPFHFSESKLSLLLALLIGLDKQKKSIQPSKVAEKLGIKRSSVTKQLNWLEENGFISRNTSAEDQRMIDVGITQKGYRLLNGAMPKYWQTCAEMSNRLTEKETAFLVTLLQKIHR
jgi:DNA-binding MarR family transcriptional regulator